MAALRYSAILGAGTDPGENAIAPPQGGNSGSWFDPVIDNSLWFRFVVPPSGAVEIELCDSATNFDTQIAVYQTGDCADYSTFSLLDANDDKEEGCLIGDQFSSYLANCFTPGDTLYLLVDGFEGEEGEFGITLTEVTVLSTLCYLQYHRSGMFQYCFRSLLKRL